MLKVDQIRTFFVKNGGILTAEELRSKGVTHYFIRKMIRSGDIEIIKRGIYKLTDLETNEYAEALKIVPKGILCLYSSAIIHELSTFIPTDYHIAIPKGGKVTLPDYPPIQLYYWEKTQYSIGIEQIDKEGHQISIYDLEKTVCDFLKFRDKIGLETTKEVLKTYLNKGNKDLNKLSKYAKRLRIHSVVDQYLRILL